MENEILQNIFQLFDRIVLPPIDNVHVQFGVCQARIG